MPKTRKTQRQLMRELYKKYKTNESRIISHYVSAEKTGIVIRKSNVQSITPEQYAQA